jgi:hypothetical protein
LDAGANTIVFDNVRSNRGSAIESQSLERMITEENYRIRRLGGNTFISGPNHVLVMMTLNEGEFNTDLASRIVFCQMAYAGSPRKRKLPADVGEPAEYAKQHRTAILQELLGLVERWQAAGRPRRAVKSCRFREWAELINGVLKANGITNFLASYETDQAQYDRGCEELATLAAARPNRWLAAKDWAKVAQSLSVWRAELDGAVTDKQLGTRIAARLRDVENREVNVFEPNTEHCTAYVLKTKKDGHTGTKRYGFFQQVPVARVSRPDGLKESCSLPAQPDTEEAQAFDAGAVVCRAAGVEEPTTAETTASVNPSKYSINEGMRELREFRPFSVQATIDYTRQPCRSRLCPSGAGADITTATTANAAISSVLSHLSMREFMHEFKDQLPHYRIETTFTRSPKYSSLPPAISDDLADILRASRSELN